MINRYFYLCNQKRDCNFSSSCGKKCTHTMNEQYAKNDAKVRTYETDTCIEGDEMVKIYWEVGDDD